MRLDTTVVTMFDRIDVQLQNDKQVSAAIASNEAYIKSETLTENLKLIDNLSDGIEIAFDEVNTKLFIQKH